jgi:site-specific recombinase XerD
MSCLAARIWFGGWATRAVEAGIDLVTLAAMLGHSKINMVLRYAHPTQEHQSKAMDKMEL